QSCSAPRAPATLYLSLEWLHDGKPLAAANRLRMVNEFGYCSLDYEVAYARDSGVITCRATNKYGVDQTSATLIVKDEKGLVEETQLPEGRKGAHRIDEMERMAHEGGPYGVTAEEETEKMKPEIVLLPEPVSVLEGETARFRCRVTGYPAPKVNWYLNGQLIRKSKRYRLRYDGIYYLEIIEIKSYDAGERREITADYHKDLDVSVVGVEAQLRTESRPLSILTASSQPVQLPKEAPLVTDVKQQRALVQREDYWNIMHSVNITDTQTLEEGHTTSLTTPEKFNAEYTCKASNQHGSDECSASLSVTGKSDARFLLLRWLCLELFIQTCCP
uniref:Ig-like domain-containing protein n=1 Tax=Stegastes partitus TaxID=144197 RepID=A0A3B5AE65_9TELE